MLSLLVHSLRPMRSIATIAHNQMHGCTCVLQLGVAGFTTAPACAVPRCSKAVSEGVGAVRIEHLLTLCAPLLADYRVCVRVTLGVFIFWPTTSGSASHMCVL